MSSIVLFGVFCFYLSVYVTHGIEMSVSAKTINADIEYIRRDNFVVSRLLQYIIGTRIANIPDNPPTTNQMPIAMTPSSNGIRPNERRRKINNQDKIRIYPIAIPRGLGVVFII